MKTFEEVLNICNRFILYDQNDTEKIIELNYVRDYINTVMSKNDLILEDHCIRVSSVLDDMSLMIMKRAVKKELKN